MCPHGSTCTPTLYAAFSKIFYKNNVKLCKRLILKLELRRLKNLVYQSDPKAFVFANTIKEASGGIVKKLHKH